MTDILIADDHPVVLTGLAALFRESEYSVVACCANGTDVFDALRRCEPAILLLDINMPAPDGLSIARRVRAEGKSVGIVLLTSSMDDLQVLEAIKLGVEGLVLKESAPRQLIQCLDAVRAGDRWIDPQITRRAVDDALSRRNAQPTQQSIFTPRELEITRLLSQGLRNKEIGRKMNITEGTVKMYLHAIYEKINVNNRIELINFAKRAGLIN